MRLPSLSFLVLDTETTGFVPAVHRVIEYAAVAVKDGKVVRELSELLSHGGDIPPPVQVLTQIKPEDLAGKPTFKDMLPQMSEMLGNNVLVVGQNVQFDIGMLKGEGWDISASPSIDTSMLASLVFPELKSYSLGYLSDALSLNHEPRHRALGDVHATTELLSKCWERLLEIPDDLFARIHELSKRTSGGYRLLFEALASERKPVTKRPAWMTAPPRSARAVANGDGQGAVSDMQSPQPPDVQMLEETMSPEFLGDIMQSAATGEARTWVGVKNLEASLRRVSLPDNVTVLYPPEYLLRTDAKDILLAQKELTADEFTLAAKLLMYTPVVRSEAPIHGGEYDVWNGKLACTSESPEYLERMKSAGKTALIDHQQLLRIIDAETPLIPKDTHVILDDASMLEDTATYAYGWSCCTDSLRAAAQGHALLTKCADLIELWMEKTRSATDVRYVTQNDLTTPEAKGLLARVTHLLTEQGVPAPAAVMLGDLQKMLDPKNLTGRIVWIELYQDKTLHLKSVPEDIAAMLKERLYSRCPTSLVIPPGMADLLQTIFPRGTTKNVVPATVSSADALEVRFPENITIQNILHDPLGKTVVLLGSKRIIEDLYVKHYSSLDAKGIALFCQGYSGGQGRMQAEFAAAKEPAFLLTTPWTYETFELQPGTVDRIFIQSLPFDFPHHPVYSRRAAKHADPFKEYSLARTKCRIFRVLRTFCRHRKAGAMAAILDERLRSKAYGKDIMKYLGRFGMGEEVEVVEEKAVRSKKKGDDQMSLL